MNLDGRLGIWGIDHILGDDKEIYAKNYYCVECYKKDKKVRAEVFWEPIMDSNIGLKPYCKPCKEKLRSEMIKEYLISIMEDSLNKNEK